MKGQYVVYERACRGEERFFLDIAKEVVEEIDEPKSWKKRKDSRKRGGGRTYDYEFRPMLLVLMLMAYHRKEYREMEAHLKSNPYLLQELGLKKAPSKSSIHSAASRISIDTLAGVNDVIVARFKKILEELERSM